jgi:hypothetical protein
LTRRGKTPAGMGDPDTEARWNSRRWDTGAERQLETPSSAAEPVEVAQRADARAMDPAGLPGLIGNRAFGRMVTSGRLPGRPLARQAWSNVSVKKRFDLPIHSFDQNQVRALYLGIGIVYSGEATWDEASGSWLVDRDQVIGVPAGGRSGGTGSGWPTKEDIDAFEAMLDQLLALEQLPERGTATDVDLYTTAHTNAVKAVINFYLLKAHYMNLDDENTRDFATPLLDLKLAGRLITLKRQESDEASQSLILRDAQRYFYGRLAPFIDIDKMESKASGGLDPLDPAASGDIYVDDPDLDRVDQMKGSTAKYEMAKKFAKLFGSDLKASSHPSSAPGGFDWLRKGGEDATDEVLGKRYRLEGGRPVLVK